MSHFPNKNYFTMPNEIFSLGLDASEIAVYAYLRCLENRRTYQCWPSYFGAASVDAAAGISTTTDFTVCAVSARSVTAASAVSEEISCAFWDITGSGSEAAAPPLNACSRLMASETLSVCWVGGTTC